ncbi:MAG: MFS transporter [Candidatus Lokiarchaeota archaeon]|nr:MFS transporter [Candidatus Lokiarchaeota archaeon]
MNSERNIEKDSKYLPYEPRMEPAPQNTLNAKRTILISLSFFTVLLAWSYFNFKVPLILDEILSTIPLKDLIKGSIMAIDNIIAVVLQPFFGDLSDRTKSKLGRRMPFIIIGTTSAAIFFIIIPWMRILAGLILIIFLFDLAMSIYRSASIAILPDYTSETEYSKGSSIQQFIANMGGLFAFTIPIIMGGLQNSLSAAWFDAMGFLIISVIMLVLVVVQFIKVKETPTGDKFFQISHNKLEIEPSTFKAREIVKSSEISQDRKVKLRSYHEFVEIIKSHKDFAYFLGTVVFMYLAFASVEAFFSSFAVDYFDITESAAGTLFLFYSGPMILSAIFVGMLGQNKKIGRKNAVKIFLTWLIISLVIMAFLVVPITYHNHNQLLTIIVLVLIAVPWMGFIVNSFSILWTLAPKEKTGIYTGMYYTFNQTAYALAPVLFGGLLSIFIDLGDFRYIIMFPYILILVIIAYVLFFRVKGGNISSDENQ